MHLLLHHSHQCHQKLKVLDDKHAFGREHALEQRPELEEMQEGSALAEGKVLEAAVGREHALEQWPELEECPASLKTIAASGSSSTMRKD